MLNLCKSLVFNRIHKIMKINNKNLKTLVFSLGLAAMTLTANNLNAEDGGGLFNGRLFAGGGLFGLGPMPESEEAISEESLFRVNTYPITDDGSITINGIGQSEAPLGSGIAILIGAGLGYVALKKKEDGQ